MDYLVTGCTRLNDIHYADGRKVEGILGGALYTAAGIKPFTDSVLLVSTVGPDFDTYYGGYFRQNGLSTAGLQWVLPKTEYTFLEYHADGRWWEYSKYGQSFTDTWGETALIQAAFILAHASPQTKGIYLESSVQEAVWQGLDDIRKAAPNAKIMWEVATGDANDPRLRDQVAELIRQCDIYSINLPESMAFFGSESEADSIQRILAFGRPCFFRVGEKGAYMIENGQAWFAPAVQVEKSVDATGCGNCSTGTALYGFCEQLHPLKTVLLANRAAHLNALQYGPYPHFTADLRQALFTGMEAEFLRRMEEKNVS